MNDSTTGNVKIRKATLADCRQLAELALIAGEGIPGYFWEHSRKPGEEIIDTGARNVASETENFSYRNMHVATINEVTAGMMLAYRLPDADHADDINDYPEFIRPMIELEQCVPSSFYINMMATYPQFRNNSVGSTLLGIVDTLASSKHCSIISLEVFEQNYGARRLYERLGFKFVDSREIMPHSSHPYTGKVFLMTRPLKF